MEKIRPFRDAPAERDVIVEPVTALRHWECLDLLMEAYSLGKKNAGAVRGRRTRMLVSAGVQHFQASEKLNLRLSLL